MAPTGKATRASRRSAILGRTRTLLPRLLALPAIAGAGVLLVACGGSSAPSSVAQEQKAETKLADDAKCLREHGVNAEVATLPGGGRGLKMGLGGRAARVPGLMHEAQKACARYQPEAQKVNLSPQQKVEGEEDVQQFAKCMREHGIKLETHTSTAGGGLGIRIGIQRSGAGGSGPNPASPAFQEAQKACQSLLPRPPGSKGAFPKGPPPAGAGPKGAGEENKSGAATTTGG
jgi:hypothetical protein